MYAAALLAFLVALCHILLVSFLTEMLLTEAALSGGLGGLRQFNYYAAVCQYAPIGHVVPAVEI